MNHRVEALFSSNQSRQKCLTWQWMQPQMTKQTVFWCTSFSDFCNKVTGISDSDDFALHHCTIAAVVLRGKNLVYPDVFPDQSLQNCTLARLRLQRASQAVSTEVALAHVNKLQNPQLNGPIAPGVHQSQDKLALTIVKALSLDSHGIAWSCLSRPPTQSFVLRNAEEA